MTNACQGKWEEARLKMYSSDNFLSLVHESDRCKIYSGKESFDCTRSMPKIMHVCRYFEWPACLSKSFCGVPHSPTVPTHGRAVPEALDLMNCASIFSPILTTLYLFGTPVSHRGVRAKVASHLSVTSFAITLHRSLLVSQLLLGLTLRSRRS